ncbi:MAG TPA: sialate O-acetylesterase [Anditalea sp.]|nr:sialate O-acetylesterase [Anditalea sp.]
MSTSRLIFFCSNILLLIFFIKVDNASAEVKLPYLISDGMVLQRDTDIKIWGWADPGESLTISFKDQKFSVKANNRGRWELVMETSQAGGPYKMDIQGEDNIITLNDVWIGDVWLCSGQSNMETTMERVSPMFPEEFKNIPPLPIRYFDVPDDYSFTDVKKDLKGGKWAALNEENIMSFAAVAYFFSKRIHFEKDIPIGIINASVGGSPIEAWLSEEHLKQFQEDYAEAVFFQTPGVIDSIERADRNKIKAWQDELNSKDLGLRDTNNPWFSTQLEIGDWTLMDEVDLLPAENNRPVNGVYWFRKEIFIDKSDLPKEDAKLLLGTLIDSDQTYVNGQLVGSTGYRYPPRRYTIPYDLLKEGKNVITIRIVSERGRGGFVTEKPYQLHLDDQIIDLSKEWYYKQGARLSAAPSQTSIRFKPMGLYNAMIAPLSEVKIKGILWYQGESNTGRAAKYEKQLHTLIDGWRKLWDNPELPFIYVQLPNFMSVSDVPQESDWAEFREVQRKTLNIPNTGMAITIDVGEANDIHPLDKKSVGDRLALQALKVAYGEEREVFSGPLIEKGKVKNGKITLTFSEVGEGLKFNRETEDSLNGFALAGPDGKFIWAKARIVGKNKVEVWHPTLKSPKILRYAWADNPEWANLYNSAELPASPFQITLD